MSSPKTIELRLLEYLKPEWKSFAAGAVCSVGMSATSLGVAAIAYRAQTAIETHSQLKLIYVCLLVIGTYFARWFFSVGQAIWFGEVSQSIGVKMRTDIYSHLQKLSLSYFDNQRIGNLLATFSYDVPLVQNGVMSIKDAIIAPVLVIGGFVWILIISWRMTVITILLLPLMAFIIHLVTRKLKAISLETQNRLADVTTIAEETLSGARLVRGFCAEDREISRYQRGVQAAKDIAMTGIRRAAVLSPTTDVLGAIGIAAAVWIGGSMAISAHGVQEAGLVSFIVLIDRVRVGVSGIGSLQSTYKQTMGAAERVFSGVLDVPPAVADAPDAQTLTLKRASVEFKNVGFEYISNRPVLKGISFEMKPGQVTALVGPSGAGKSTVADLIPRFYDTTDGSVYVDGQDIRTLTARSLREHMAIVPQETIIFGGTVRENITYGRPDAALDEVVSAAKAANAHQFISELPFAYDSVLGEKGVTLSGGQRQRIAIARALLKDPRILILDEATSSLDEESQQLVQEALEKLMEGRTTLVIAHRLSTIKNADQIIVMHQGKISEMGSHQELMHLGGEYARLYETQFRSNGSDEMIHSAASLLA